MVGSRNKEAELTGFQYLWDPGTSALWTPGDDCTSICYISSSGGLMTLHSMVQREVTRKDGAPGCGRHSPLKALFSMLLRDMDTQTLPRAKNRAVTGKGECGP